MPTASILGTGAARDLLIASSLALDNVHDLAQGLIDRLTEVVQRAHADAGDRVALAALPDAGCEAEALGAILHAAAVPYQITPAAVPLVQRSLGFSDGAVAVYDIAATCLGSVAALLHAAAMVETGRCKRVLVVASEGISDKRDCKVPSTVGLFGDGADVQWVRPFAAMGGRVVLCHDPDPASDFKT